MHRSNMPGQSASDILDELEERVKYMRAKPALDEEDENLLSCLSVSLMRSNSMPTHREARQAGPPRRTFSENAADTAHRRGYESPAAGGAAFRGNVYESSGRAPELDGQTSAFSHIPKHARSPQAAPADRPASTPGDNFGSLVDKDGKLRYRTPSSTDERRVAKGQRDQRQAHGPSASPSMTRPDVSKDTKDNFHRRQPESGLVSCLKQPAGRSAFGGSPLHPLPEQRGDLPGRERGDQPISQTRSISGSSEQLRRDTPRDTSSDDEVDFKRCTVNPEP